MKKRVLCLIIALAMVLPLILASCNDVRSDEEIIQSILGGKDAAIALTLSIWVPTDADLSTPESKNAFETRLKAVEERINEILIEKNYSTKIDLIAYADDEYDQIISDKFASMEGKKGEAYRKGQAYENQIDYYYPDENDKSNFIYQIKYPDVLEDCQLDIFLMRGYEDFITHVENGDLEALDTYISANGSVYSNINKLIRPNILAQMKYDKKTYAIPNNHLYAQDKYQFVLIDKALFDSYGLEIQDIGSVVDTEEFIKLVAADASNSAVPFVGSINDAPGLFIYDTEMNMGSVVGSGSPANIYDHDSYSEYVSFIKRVSEMVHLHDDLENNDVAVQFMYGASTDIENLEKNLFDNGNTVYSGKVNGKDYYILKSDTPVAELDDVYSSMFAISKYSINPDRAMKVLYLLQSNEEIRTLLQYGIENVDYKIEYDEDTLEEKIVLKDTAYKMNILYTGNGYYTYPEDNSFIDDWQYVKDVNFDMVINPLIGLDYYYNSDKITEEEKAEFLANREVAIPIAQAYKLAIDNMSSEEYDTFSAINLDEVLANVDLAKQQIESSQDMIDSWLEEIEKINSNTEMDEAQKQEELAYANSCLETANANLEEANTKLTEAYAPISEYEFLLNMLNSKEYQAVLDFYAKLYNFKNR
ncbi:MAG: hypothetical protein IJ400_01590 [Clostridia bacterium]|nr:hypothetical protein [Clostridia bacterium]